MLKVEVNFSSKIWLIVNVYLGAYIRKKLFENGIILFWKHKKISFSIAKKKGWAQMILILPRRADIYEKLSAS